MGYLNLNIGVRGRMNELQRRADRINNAQYNLRKSQGDNTPYNWRDVRYSGFHNAAANQVHLSQGRHDGRPIWYTHNGPQFPREIFADECNSSIQHKGWFSDNIQNGTIRGLVVALPHGRFLAGYFHDDTGERVYFADIYDCERAAAYAADGHAESVAEDMRDADRRYCEALDLQEKEWELERRLRECLALRNHSCFEALRTEAKHVIKSIRDIRETLNSEYADVL